MKQLLRVLRKAELLLVAAVLKADRYLGMGGRDRPPAPIAVRVASRPLRSAAVVAAPLAAMGGMTFGAFSDGTRFLQAVLLGIGVTLILALFLRLERLTQLHYARVGYDALPPAPRPQPDPPAPRPQPGGLGRFLALLCTGWGVGTVAFWAIERLKGTPVSWLVSGVLTGLLHLGAGTVSYLMGRKRLRARPPGRS
ncbi:hypothetical protein [Streptomyces sp. NPDC058394]|uniref:hypothetical protein n=1 Tax=unclassified Streptomyces TaxID=2593676 RepID=UPI003663AAD6